MRRTWTAAIPPMPGYYWWIDQVDGHPYFPTVAYLTPHQNEEGEFTDEPWTWTLSADPREVSADNGLWWHVPLVMPPPVGVF